MPEITDPNATRPILVPKVIYRCTCGADLQLALEVGGTCPRCQRVISPRILQHEMSISTICDGSFELASPDEVETAAAIISNSQSTEKDDFAGKATLPALDGKVARTTSGASVDVMNGKRFGHFEILTPLGRGGMGQVYRALDTSLQRFVAVKLLRSGIPPANADIETETRSPLHEVDKLLQEAITQARVAHPNIVTIYYVGKEAGHPFLAMELVNGKPLNARIAEGPLPFSTIAVIASQITSALKFSYDLDLIHGDIKPSNILIQQDGFAKLSDFGMARNVSHDTSEAIGGTLNYIAPEILRGSKPSLQTDIYALGVTFYEMSFGTLPCQLEGNNIAEWIAIHEQNQLTFPNPWPDHLPEAWKEILAKMLACEPQDRYQTYESLVEDLTRIKPNSPVVARPFPRIVAAGVDWITVLATATGMQYGLQWYRQVKNLSDWQMMAMHLIPMVVYLLIVYLWRQSLGRNLMQIKVANKFGHRPKSLQMFMRCLFRMQFPIVIVIWLLFPETNYAWGNVVLGGTFIVSTLFLLIELAMIAFYPQRRSIHDLIFGTKVLVDIH